MRVTRSELMVPKIVILWEPLWIEMQDYLCKIFVVRYSSPLPTVGFLKDIAVRKTKPKRKQKSYTNKKYVKGKVIIQ
jgi:hypothetical protein